MLSGYKAPLSFTYLLIILTLTMPEVRLSPQFDIPNLKEYVKQQHEGKERLFVMNATNKLLSMFFEEIENGID